MRGCHGRTHRRRIAWNEGKTLELADQEFFALHHVYVLLKRLAVGKFSAAVADVDSGLCRLWTELDMLLERLDIILKSIAVHATQSINSYSISLSLWGFEICRIGARHVYFAKMLANVCVQTKDMIAFFFLRKRTWVHVQIRSPATVHAAF